jgi:hypothetical protein
MVTGWLINGVRVGFFFLHKFSTCKSLVNEKVTPFYQPDPLSRNEWQLTDPTTRTPWYQIHDTPLLPSSPGCQRGGVPQDVQQFSSSAVQQFSSSAVQQFNSSAIQQFSSHTMNPKNSRNVATGYGGVEHCYNTGATSEPYVEWQVRLSPRVP